ncbi:unnamed protein product [Rangifer tarandus platyrhynchus]|uniref:Uncharacterized protein n=2 Tax=Rangifer tarandus platyrhynchus TaxID=3082113 RepID=A0AC59YT71_RANTA|nr:unnamed protein product [Rangifer tarandus platyrhynchus]
MRPYGLWPSRLLCPWNSPDKNTGVGCPGDLPNPQIQPVSPVSCIGRRVLGKSSSICRPLEITCLPLPPTPATTYVYTVIKHQEKSEISHLGLSWRFRPLRRPSSGSLRLRAPRTL